MNDADTPKRSGQPRVDQFFDSTAGYWSDVYGRTGLQGVIYRERMYTALRWIDDLDLPRGAGVLELGCGAGLLSAELARRGYRVTAADSSPEMVRLASERARALHEQAAMTVVRADVQALPFGADQFELVVALGLLPWVEDPARALGEIERVLTPGGSAVLTADNRARLNFLVDPRENPVLLPLKLPFGILKRGIGRTGDGAPSYLHLPSEISGLLTRAGLRTVRRATVGYGPLTVLGRPVLSEAAGLRLHAALVALSRDRAPSLRRHGWHYVVAARKPDA